MLSSERTRTSSSGAVRPERACSRRASARSAARRRRAWPSAPPGRRARRRSRRRAAGPRRPWARPASRPEARATPGAAWRARRDRAGQPRPGSRVAAEPLGGAARPLSLVLERRERCAEARLEARVRAARDAAVGDVAEAPEGGRERQQRKRQERADQLEFEAPQHCPSVSLCRADNPLESLSAGGGRT